MHQLKKMKDILSQVTNVVTIVCHANIMWSPCLLNRVKQQLCDKRKIGPLNLALIGAGAETVAWSLFCNYYNEEGGRQL